MRQIIPKQRTSRSGAGLEVIKRPGKEDLEEDSTHTPAPPQLKQGRVQVRAGEIVLNL